MSEIIFRVGLIPGDSIEARTCLILHIRRSAISVADFFTFWEGGSETS